MPVRTDSPKKNKETMDAIYAEAADWHLNTDGETIHAKRVPGIFRNLKYWTSSIWLVFFFGAYLRWGDRQAVLFDIPARQFHLFGITILPQDFWMFALLMIFFAILLAVSTAIMGRVFCGFFCFQTVWVDVYTWIETTLEGTPQKRRKLEKAPWSFNKIKIKTIKHSLWLLIAVLTGISFLVWFSDAYEFWVRLFHFELSVVELSVLALFTAGTYLLAGFLREQTCFWLCPYARIQGVMIDNSTAVVSYDIGRGEPRGRVNKKKAKEDDAPVLGDCVDCKQCIAVCPTGVDIRHGQQEGCINCALCIDACDTVMDKLGRDKGLIGYQSLDQMEGRDVRGILQRPRIWIYGAILSLALVGIGYGISTIESVELKVLHERQPMFILESDGSIKNKYKLKILNKTLQDINVSVSVTGLKGVKLSGLKGLIMAEHSDITSQTVYLQIERELIKQESTPIIFHIHTMQDGEEIHAERQNIFIGPK